MKRMLTLLSGALATVALSGPVDEKKGEAHLRAIAASDVEALMADYAPDAYLDWVGGPLEGRYHGKTAIRAVWTKFIALNDGQPRPAHVGKLSPYANPKGVSIEAAAEYGGKIPIKAWHVLVYRDGVLTTEIWQIAPTLKVDD